MLWLTVSGAGDVLPGGSHLSAVVGLLPDTFSGESFWDKSPERVCAVPVASAPECDKMLMIIVSSVSLETVMQV